MPSPTRTLYSPIEKWQTRVLRLHSGRYRDQLNADLIVADLVELDTGVALHDELEHVEYEAISYSWGLETPNSLILCNNCACLITSSCAEALKRFRFQQGSRYLWADAICINQADGVEKSAQIQQMFNIFNKASTVLVWLGDADRLTGTAMNFLKNQKLLVQQLYWSDTRRDSRDFDLDDLQDESPGSVSLRAGMKDLLLPSWPKRAWVQQEIFAARDIRIVCGKYETSFDGYKAAAELLPQYELIDLRTDEGQALNRSIGAVKALCKGSLDLVLTLARDRIADQVIKRQDEDSAVRICPCFTSDVTAITQLHCHIGRRNYLEATDTRDRIYALLSMSDVLTSTSRNVQIGRTNHGLPIDYTKPTSAVFQDMTKYFINRYGTLGILWGHNPQAKGKSDMSLPSWCPDWRNFGIHLRLESCMDNFSVDLQRYDDEGLLKVSCHLYGRITRFCGLSAKTTNRPFSLCISGSSYLFTGNVDDDCLLFRLQTNEWVLVLRSTDRFQQGCPLFSYAGIGVRINNNLRGDDFRSALMHWRSPAIQEPYPVLDSDGWLQADASCEVEDYQLPSLKHSSACYGTHSPAPRRPSLDDRTDQILVC